MKDWTIRALKTFVQAFFGVLVPEVVVWCTNLATIDWASWQTWLMPIVGAALAAGISAVWNAILEAQRAAKEGAEEDE